MKPMKRPLLIEILLVLGIIAAMAAMGILSLTQARRTKNERHVRLALIAFHKAEESFRTELQSDRDDDGNGEFGTLAEMLGLKESFSYRRFSLFSVPVPEKQRMVLEDLRKHLKMSMQDDIAASSRDTEEALLEGQENPTATVKKKKKKKKKRTGPAQFVHETKYYSRVTNELIFDGYVYRVLLPQLTQERKDLTEEEKISALTDEVEQYWCAYAWPLRYGRSGQNSYFIDFNGRLYTRDDPAMTGAGRDDIHAIDAYEGREFETPVDKTNWKDWLELTSPKPKPKKEEGEEPADDEEKTGEGKEGEPTKDKEPKTEIGPKLPVVPEAAKKDEREQERLKEATEETDLEIGD